MKNLYKNRKPDSRVVASVKYEINKNRGLLSDSLLDSCLKAVDNNAKKSAWLFQAVKVKYKKGVVFIC